MATEKVSQLPAVTNATLADVIYAIQAGISSQETLQQVYNLFSANVVQNYNGNPNGHLAGTQYQSLAWDSTDNFLWICTTTGSAATAVWKPVIGALTNGQLPIGSTGNAPSAATITAGTGISVTNGAGSITIASTATGVSWNVVTTNQSMSPENGYIANSGGGLTFTLPTTASVGTALAAMNLNTGGWTIAQNASQNIRLGSSITTTGAGGSLASTSQGDSIYLICAVANTTWIALSVQGNITVV